MNQEHNGNYDGRYSAVGTNLGLSSLLTNESSLVNDSTNLTYNGTHEEDLAEQNTMLGHISQLSQYNQEITNSMNSNIYHNDKIIMNKTDIELKMKKFVESRKISDMIFYQQPRGGSESVCNNAVQIFMEEIIYPILDRNCLFKSNKHEALGIVLNMYKTKCQDVDARPKIYKEGNNKDEYILCNDIELQEYFSNICVRDKYRNLERKKNHERNLEKKFTLTDKNVMGFKVSIKIDLY